MEKYILIRQQRKTLSMRLDKDGNITVCAPLYLSKTETDRFVSGHARWIARKRAELSACNPLQCLTISEGEKIPLFGEEYTLNLWNKRFVSMADGVISLPQNNSKKALIRFYRRQLKAYIEPVLSHYAREINVQPAKVAVGSARTRWGACSGNNRITFSFRLAMCDRKAVEYVIVHELCHILHKNHSKAFWYEVERYCSYSKQAKLYLKQKSYFMEII